jgi:hypothetical protein
MVAVIYGKRQVAAPGSVRDDVRALQGGSDKIGIIQLARAVDAVAKCFGIDGPFGRLNAHKIIEKIHAVLPGQCLSLCFGDVIIEPHRPVFGQLRIREGAGKIVVGIAQHLQDGRYGFLHLTFILRPESPVGVSP